MSVRYYLRCLKMLDYLERTMSTYEMYKNTRSLYSAICNKIKINSIGQVVNTYTGSGFTIIDVYFEDEIYAVLDKDGNQKLIRLSTITKLNENLCR